MGALDLPLAMMRYGWPRREYRERKSVACKYCGSTKVHWRADAFENWRLYESNGQRHTCRQYRKEDTPDAAR